MSTRYTADPQTRFGLFPGLPSGFQSKSSSDVVVPSVGIEDVDLALFQLFNEQIPLYVSDKDVGTRRVPIVFFAGEKWALNKRMQALRDRSNSLILPLLTAVRTSIVQDSVQDVTGRGINQQTGEIVVHRRLDKSDRAYQGIINRLLLKNQKNLAVNPIDGVDGQLTTLQQVGDLADDPAIEQGGLLLGDRTNNVFETIVVPAPQFFTAEYDCTIWTQYTSHMNQLIEALIASYLPQGNCWKIESPKGYWFIASVDGNQFTADMNTDDYSQEERLIRYKFVVKVPGYILASSVPGSPVPIKRYVSAPVISFQTGVPTNIESSSGGMDDPFLGSDDPTLPLSIDNDGSLTRRDQRRTNGTRLYPKTDEANPDDPALKSLKRGTKPAQFKKIIGIDKKGRQVTKLFRVKNINSFTGETVFAPDSTIDGLTIVVTDD